MDKLVETRGAMSGRGRLLVLLSGGLDSSLLFCREAIVPALRDRGFLFVPLDLEGFAPGRKHHEHG